MKRIFIVLLIFLPLSVWAKPGTIASTTAGSKAPQLWSGFKDLNKTKEACELQSSFVLKKLKVQNRVQNEYGNYGTVEDSRIVVKCIDMRDGTSKVWVAVAGYDTRSVEALRNLLIKEIN